MLPKSKISSDFSNIHRLYEFKELQQKVVKNALAYGERHELQIDKDFAVIKLFEEVGELAQAILIHNKKCRKSKRVPDDVSKKRTGQRAG